MLCVLARSVHAEEIEDPPQPTPPGEYAERRVGEYFRGEIKGGFTLMGMGVVGLSLGGALLATSDSETLKGASYPLLGFGLAHLAAGVFVNLTSVSRIRRAAVEIPRDPQGWVKREQKRMRGVSKQFLVLSIIEGVGIAGGIGLGIYGQREHRPELAGIGFGLASEFGATLLFDLIAGERAKRYRGGLALITF